MYEMHRSSCMKLSVVFEWACGPEFKISLSLNVQFRFKKNKKTYGAWTEKACEKLLPHIQPSKAHDLSSRVPITCPNAVLLWQTGSYLSLFSEHKSWSWIHFSSYSHIKKRLHREQTWTNTPSDTREIWTLVQSPTDRLGLHILNPKVQKCVTILSLSTAKKAHRKL